MPIKHYWKTVKYCVLTYNYIYLSNAIYADRYLLAHCRENILTTKNSMNIVCGFSF